MKYLKQFTLIVLFSFLGEICRYLIPYPIPASIYGMALMFAALSLRIIKIENIKEAGTFLATCLPVLFVAPLVNLTAYWDQLRENLLPIALIVVVSTFITFGIAGIVTQILVDHEKGAQGHD